MEEHTKTCEKTKAVNGDCSFILGVTEYIHMFQGHVPSFTAPVVGQDLMKCPLLRFSSLLPSLLAASSHATWLPWERLPCIVCSEPWFRSVILLHNSSQGVLPKLSRALCFFISSKDY